MGSNGLFLLLAVNNSFLIPLDRFPTLKLDSYLVGNHILEQIEVDKSIDGVPSNIERLINLNEDCSHAINQLI